VDLLASLIQISNMTPPSRSSSSSGTSSSSSDDEYISPARGLPDTILVGLAAMNSARRKRLSNQNQHGGSRPGKRPNRNLGREEAGHRLYADFFLPETEANPYGGIGPIFTPAEFERRLRINPRVYERVKFGVLESDRKFFEQRADAVGTLGATADQKICISLRLLGQGIGADSVVEVSRLSESTSAKCLKRFCAAVTNAFGSQYLRLPTADDLKRTEATYSKLGLPGCIGAVDCASWQWGACPVAEQGLHRGKDGKPTLRLEAWCDDRLWIWSLFFGMPGSRNDINVMNASPLFQSIRAGTFPPARPATNVEGLNLTWYYFLVDAIYPRYRIFLTTYTRPENNKQKMFSKVQEGARKAVERLFAVLFSRWHVLYRPARGWHVDDLLLILTTCCILHNMIIEDREESSEDSTAGTRNILSFDESAPPSEMVLFPPTETREAQAQHWRETADLVENLEQHNSLKNAVSMHIWNKHGSLGDAEQNG
jgi:hypothetical protein